MSTAAPSVHPPRLIPILYILFATSIFFRHRTLILTFLAFELYWIFVLPRYVRGVHSTWNDAYSYRDSVSALVGRSVSVLLFMKPEKDLIKASRGGKQALTGKKLQLAKSSRSGSAGSDVWRS
jgi:hypothetical protein